MAVKLTASNPIINHHFFNFAVESTFFIPSDTGVTGFENDGDIQSMWPQQKRHSDGVMGREGKSKDDKGRIPVVPLVKHTMLRSSGFGG